MERALRRLVFSFVLLLAACQPPPEQVATPLVQCASLRVQGNVLLQLKLYERDALEQAGQIIVADAQQPDQNIDIKDEQPVSVVSYKGDEPLSVNVFCQRYDTVELLGKVEASWLQSESNLTDSLKLAAYGGSRLETGAIAADQVDLRLSGSAQMQVREVNADAVSMLVSGSGKLLVSGLAAQANAELSGQAQVDAEQLQVQSSDVRLRGTSQLTIWSTAHISGSARQQALVRYQGGPDISVLVEEQAQVQPLTGTP